MATAKKSTKKPAKKAPAKKAAKKAAPKKAAPKKAAKKPAKKAVKKAVKKAPAKKPVKKAPPKKVAKKAPAKKPAAAPKKAAAPAKFVPAPRVATPVAKGAPAPRPVKAAKKPPPPPPPERPPVKGVTKDGIAYTKDFDAKWLTAQRALLLLERASVLGQAVRLEAEATQIIEEQEMGDVQFDDEGGEGDTMVVERERDIALGAQARQTVADIEAALERLKTGAYGYSVESARPIPRERLEAIPWATVLVEEKVGGIGRL
ncbi:MAG: hypothetical protein ABL953_00205 [Ilumatobacteraceae bacterium]